MNAPSDTCERSSGTGRAVLSVTWIVLVVAGVTMLGAYRARPGAEGDPAPTRPRWLAPGDTGRTAVVVAVHPQCVCTRATIAELARAAAIIGDRGSIDIYVFAPEGAQDRWTDTASVRAAEAIPGARVHLDHGGRRAADLGLTTSGHVAVYNTGGQLRFCGGITQARGHEGDSRGKKALIDISTGRWVHERVLRTPVYGCPLATEPPGATR